ncbi:hypothetical protein FB451DRAFT_1568581 [Mycena latifolia]|nr:hypothetical protein FB451DRAFT_1568581 [Mycena latifolia]
MSAITTGGRPATGRTASSRIKHRGPRSKLHTISGGTLPSSADTYLHRLGGVHREGGACCDNPRRAATPTLPCAVRANGRTASHLQIVLCTSGRARLILWSAEYPVLSATVIAAGVIAPRGRCVGARGPRARDAPRKDSPADAPSCTRVAAQLRTRNVQSGPVPLGVWSTTRLGRVLGGIRHIAAMRVPTSAVAAVAALALAGCDELLARHVVGLDGAGGASRVGLPALLGHLRVSPSVCEG